MSDINESDIPVIRDVPPVNDELDVHRRAVAGIRRASAEGLLTEQEAQDLIDRVRACGATAPPPRVPRDSHDLL